MLAWIYYVSTAQLSPNYDLGGSEVFKKSIVEETASLSSSVVAVLHKPLMLSLNWAPWIYWGCGILK